MKSDSKPRMAVHKFSSCDGCQLALLNAGEALFELNRLVDIVHFVEAGPCAPDAWVDIALVEGSITTAEEIERIRQIRDRSGYLIAMGACATSGGLQALRNLYAADIEQWTRAIYAQPDYIDTLQRATAISQYVRVDFELWGCPVNRRQVMAAVRSLLFGVEPAEEREKLCMECKRKQIVCLLVTGRAPCMGPVTRTGCGALCPSFGRACYACYGPAENPNTASLTHCFTGLGLLPDEIARLFHHINSDAPTFRETGQLWREKNE